MTESLDAVLEQVEQELKCRERQTNGIVRDRGKSTDILQSHTRKTGFDEITRSPVRREIGCRSGFGAPR